MDVAVIGLAAHSEPIEKATRELDKFTGASKRADAANDERIVSSRRVATSDDMATVASRANTAALQAQAAAARTVAFRQGMLAFQLNDIGVSLASGMNPLMVFIQQGAQIQQIYGGNGGAAAALSDFASAGLRLARIAGPIALVGLAFIGLQNDIEATTGTAVSFGNVFTALMQEIAAVVMNVAGPAITWLGGVFSTVAGAIFATLKLIGDSIINTFTFAIQSVVTLWEGLPGAFMDIGTRAAEGLINQIRYMAREVLVTWNELMNGLGLQQFMTAAPAGVFPDIELPNQNRGAASGLMDRLTGVYDDTFARSPMGDFFERVGARAAELARSAQNAADAVGAVGNAASNAGQPMDLLGQSVQAANDNFEAGRGIFSSFFSDLSNQIQQGASVWDAFKTAGLNALNSILSKVLEMASNNLFMGLFGGGSMGGGGGLLGGLLGSFGGFFAGGGVLGAGQWGIAGERGPEPIVGPARIISNDNYMRSANSNAPQPVVINQTNYINNPFGMEGVARAIQEGNARAVGQATNASVAKVSNIQRRTGRPLG